MKTYVIILAFSLLSMTANAQNISNLDSILVSIDWENETNKKHKYKDLYSQKDEDYIKWVYEISKNVSGYVADVTNEKNYYHDGRGNNPLVFTIEENNQVRTEMYRNAVKPSKKKKSNFSINIPRFEMPRIEGALPKGVITYFSDSSKGYEMGIELDNNFRKVKIEILDLDKKLIHIIEDKVLEEGWNHYKWDISNVKPGEYYLKYTVDENEMTQIINIEKYNGSYLKRFLNWLF